MSRIKINGGKKLFGEIIPQGAKNEALQVICASLLTESDVIISNIPDIIDVNKLIKILENLGVKISKIDSGKFSFNSKQTSSLKLSRTSCFSELEIIILLSKIPLVNV